MGKATRYDDDICSESHIGPAESKNLSMRGHSMFENREISAVPFGRQVDGSVREGLWP
jgi:hypothetical protein